MQMEARSDKCDIDLVELDVDVDVEVEVEVALPDGMEHFSSEVRQFCGFIVRYFVDWLGGLDEAWVSCHDAVYVLPHLSRKHIYRHASINNKLTSAFHHLNTTLPCLGWSGSRTQLNAYVKYIRRSYS